MQEITEAVEYELRVEDLTGVPHRDIEAQYLIDQFISQKVDVAVDPLFGAQLLRLRDDEHVLVLAMEHIISDAFSVHILMRDIFTAYTQTVLGHAVSLPEISVQFADYAAWQRGALSSWIEEHGAYWDEHFKGCQRLRFPDDKAKASGVHYGWGAVPVKIGSELKRELREWCRLRRTTLVMGIFTAYVALLLRWCSVSGAVVRYQTDGRRDPRTENTIGYFAGALYLRVELLDNDSFIDLNQRLTEEYCRAYEHADFSYIEAQLPRAGFTRNSCFNWVPKAPSIDFLGAAQSEATIRCSPALFTNPMIKNLESDAEPLILLFDTDDNIAGRLQFPLDRFHYRTMEKFSSKLLTFIRVLVKQPTSRVKDVVLL